MVVYIYAILILVLLLLLTVFTLLYASGLFEKITVYRKSPPLCLSCGPTYLYKIPDGRYDQAGYLFTEIASISPNRIQCGIHFEDENQAEPAQTSAAVGALLTGDDEDSACQESLERAGFHVTRLPPVEEALVVSFPHVSLLSIPIGSFRVYRQLRAYSEDNNLTVSGYVELYDSNWIHYIGLLTDADRFRQAICPPVAPEVDSAVENSKETNFDESPVETLEGTSLPEPTVVLPVGDTQEDNAFTDSSNTDNDLEESDASFEKIATYPVPPSH